MILMVNVFVIMVKYIKGEGSRVYCVVVKCFVRILWYFIECNLGKVILGRKEKLEIIEKKESGKKKN